MSSGGCKSRVVGCGPDCWSSPNTVCTAGRCSCLPGYQADTSSPTNILVCSLASNNSTLHQADQAAKPVNDINIHYYPGKAPIINHEINPPSPPKKTFVRINSYTPIIIPIRTDQCCILLLFQKLVF